MSVHAGRCGLVDRGIVIKVCGEKLEPTSAKKLVKGDS